MKNKTNNRRRRLLLPLTIGLVLSVAFVLTACGNGAPDAPERQAAENAGKVISENDKTLTLIDQSGREVTVKKDPQSIALCYRVVIRFLLSLDQGDKITGIGKSEDFLEELQPSLAECVDVGKGVADIEALADLKPDLFIHKASDVETLKAVEDIGIPAIGVDVESPEQMMTALEILGRVCGAEEKADKLREYYETSLKDIEDRTKDLKPGDKPRAVIMGSSIGKVASAPMLQGEMLEMAGGINCAAEIRAAELWPTAGVEQIFQWDPEYIFITGSESAVYSADDLLQDPAWSEVTAVKKKQVFVLPSEKDSWEFPGVVSVLGTEYMLSVMHPDLFTDAELQKQVNVFYKLSYGRVFTREYLGY